MATKTPAAAAAGGGGAAPSLPPRPFTPYVSDLARSPYFSYSLSALLLAAIPATVKNPIGYPHLVQLPGFALIFFGTGYMTSTGDAVNGSGTATAWSLIYLFLHGKKAILSKKPGPIGLATAVAVGAGVQGWDYFGNS